jgi:uncharacterized protein YajQ (UPF0234 family)
MPSFDVVSKVEWAEVKNAVNQAAQEVGQRFDFKGTDASIELKDKLIVLAANTEDRVNAILDVLLQKLIRRKVSLKHLDYDDPVKNLKGARLDVKVKEGIETEKAKEIVKLLKDSKMKVQAAIQEDTVRVTGKKRDDLQEAIALLKAAEKLELNLQFVNFRE